MAASAKQLDVVVGRDGTVTVPAAEIARLGARPGEHLHLVRDAPAAAPEGRKKVRGALVGKIETADLLSEQDFEEAKRARIDAVARKYGPPA
jgi:hypothetical protein